MLQHIQISLGIAVFVFSLIIMSGCPPMDCEGGEIRLNQHQMTKLAPPVQTAPEEGATFSNFPRTTNLAWDAVENATTYDIEVDCFLCCAPDAWCTDLGEPAYFSFSEIQSEEHEFDWIGAQPGRWRVRGVRFNGQAGEWSEWREFNYTV